MESPRSRATIATAAAALAAVLFGCTTPAQHPSDLESLAGTEWKLMTLGSDGAIQTHEPTLAFDEGNRISGTGSCNRFTGTVTVSGKSIAVSPLASTRMACQEALSRQEAKYFGALQQAEWFMLAGGTLTIYTKAMDQPLLFFRTRPPQ